MAGLPNDPGAIHNYVEALKAVHRRSHGSLGWQYDADEAIVILACKTENAQDDYRALSAAAHLGGARAFRELLGELLTRAAPGLPSEERAQALLRPKNYKGWPYT